MLWAFKNGINKLCLLGKYENKDIQDILCFLVALEQRCAVRQAGLRGEGTGPGVAIEMATTGIVFTYLGQNRKLPLCLLTGLHHTYDGLKST